MNFKGAVFDLDGTLLASTHIWERVDEIFFSNRNIEMPKDYHGSIAHMSLEEAATYTISRFNLTNTPKEILAEWKELSHKFYMNEVELKPHALNYLKLLQKKGIKLSVATGMPTALLNLTLEKLNILHIFNAVYSVDQAGRGKAFPDVFLLAVKGMGLKPKDCIAFDDIPTALKSAKSGGLRVIGVYDYCSAHLRGEIESFADGYIENMSQAPIPE